MCIRKETFFIELGACPWCEVKEAHKHVVDWTKGKQDVSAAEALTETDRFSMANQRFRKRD